MCDEASVNDGEGRLRRLPVDRVVVSAAYPARIDDRWFELVDDICQYGAGRVGGACHLVPIAAGPRRSALAQPPKRGTFDHSVAGSTGVK